MHPQDTMRACAHCGLAFAPLRQRSRYCGLPCARLGRRTLPTIPCLTCGQPCRRGERRARYCSPTCAFAHRHATRAARFWLRVTRTTDADSCWLLQTTGRTHRYGRAGGQAAHRYAWELASGAPILDGQCVCHTCDTPFCVRNDEAGVYIVEGVAYPRFGHLFLGTNAVNIRDKTLKGRAPHGATHMSHLHPERRPRGSAHGNARLTESQVCHIRTALAAGVPQRTLAAETGVTQSTISNIARGRVWRHVP